MKTNLTANYIDEPNLLFGNSEEEKDPRLGLDYYGPYTFPDEESPLKELKIGLIGNRQCIQKAKEFFSSIEQPIISPKPNKWLFPSFPGISSQTSFKCDIKLSKQWEELIIENEISTLLNVIDVNERIGAATELYIKKIAAILQEDDTPDVILCCIPETVEDYCGISEKTRGAKTAKLTELERQLAEFKEQNQKLLSDFGIELTEETQEPQERAYDLHNAIKGKSMLLKPALPIQLLRESSLNAFFNSEESNRNRKQDQASFAWNFSTAIYYKASGKPWRLAKLRQDTCYIGISFFRNKRSINNDMQTSMAQVFTDNGEGLVLRGSDVYVDEITKEPHLSEAQAEQLARDAIQQYIRKAKRQPVRVVIHQETLHSEAEKRGFSKAIGDTQRDFVTINKRKGIRFLRTGSYPVLRGTMITLNQHETILYTSGYSPRIRTYEGHSIPRPLLITHYGDSDMQEICTEIIGLTKLNWNTTKFSTSFPITLAFSSRVGDILSEFDDNSEQSPQNHYRFYM